MGGRGRAAAGACALGAMSMPAGGWALLSAPAAEPIWHHVSQSHVKTHGTARLFFPSACRARWWMSPRRRCQAATCRSQQKGSGPATASCRWAAQLAAQHVPNWACARSKAHSQPCSHHSLQQYKGHRNYRTVKVGGWWAGQAGLLLNSLRGGTATMIACRRMPRWGAASLMAASLLAAPPAAMCHQHPTALIHRASASWASMTSL